MFHRNRKRQPAKEYDRENLRPLIRCSICNGEQVAGFEDKRTGQFQEIMLIRNSADLALFCQTYGLTDVPKKY